MNSVNLIGNLTRDPELRDTKSETSVCAMRIAVNGRGDQDPVYVDVTAFGAQAEACAKYLRKGRKVAVNGRLHYSEWKAEDGSNRSRHSIVAQRVEFLDGKGNEPTDVDSDDEASEPVGAEL